MLFQRRNFTKRISQISQMRGEHSVVEGLPTAQNVENRKPKQGHKRDQCQSEDTN